MRSSPLLYSPSSRPFSHHLNSPKPLNFSPSTLSKLLHFSSMADSQRILKPNSISDGSQRQTTRLHRRAPVLQISKPVFDWNIAIPLLSPLVSPSSPKLVEGIIENKSREEPKRNQISETEKPVVFKKWQHPAAPFFCEPTSLVPSFIPV